MAIAEQPPTNEVPGYNNIAALQITPNLSSPGAEQLLESMFKAVEDSSSRVLILRGFGTGTVPRAANPHISRLVHERDIPVFVLSDNPGDDFGVRRLKYEAHEGLVAAGAIPLRDVNINDVERVMATIQGSIDHGADSSEIVRTVVGEFGVPDNFEEMAARLAQEKD